MPRDLLVCLSNDLLWSASGSLLRTVVASPSSLSSGALVGSPRSDGKSEASSHDDEVHRANSGRFQGTLMLVDQYQKDSGVVGIRRHKLCTNLGGVACSEKVPQRRCGSVRTNDEVGEYLKTDIYPDSGLS